MGHSGVGMGWDGMGWDTMGLGRDGTRWGRGRDDAVLMADVDECAQSPPPCAHGRCENLPGSFRCVCNAGFRSATHGGHCEGEVGAGGAAARRRRLCGVIVSVGSSVMGSLCPWGHCVNGVIVSVGSLC